MPIKLQIFQRNNNKNLSLCYNLARSYSNLCIYILCFRRVYSASSSRNNQAHQCTHSQNKTKRFQGVKARLMTIVENIEPLVKLTGKIRSGAGDVAAHLPYLRPRGLEQFRIVHWWLLGFFLFASLGLLLFSTRSKNNMHLPWRTVSRRTTRNDLSLLAGTSPFRKHDFFFHQELHKSLLPPWLA